MEDLNWKVLIVPVIVLFIFIGGVIGIVNWQQSKQKPVVSELTVNLPEGEVRSAEKELVISGKVAKGHKVFINDQEIKVEKDGSYTKTITLIEGENKVVVKDKKGNKEIASIERNVKYVKAVPETPAQPAQPAPSQGSAVPVASDLSTSGPEEVIIPVIGTGGVVFAVAFYFKSRKQLSLNLRK